MLARKHGEQAENAVRLSLELLERQGDCAAEWTYPKSKIIKRGGRTIVVYSGGGVPDVSAVFRANGHPVPAWFDVKTTGRKNRVILSSGAARQYDAMRRICAVGGLGFFLVLWRHDSPNPDNRVDEWRIHPVDTNAATVDEYAERVTLSRPNGLLVCPVDQEAPPPPTSHVWDTQIYLPNLIRVISELGDSRTKIP